MRGFGKYFRNKIGWYLLTFVVALFLNFFLPRLIPGNPVDVLLSELTAGMTDTAQAQEMKEEFYNQMGLDQPLIVQFGNYVKNMLHGDLGRSFTQYPKKVTDILGSALPWTIGIQLPSIIVGWILGNILGAVAAYKKGAFDKVIFPISLFLSSLPAFVFALLMQYTLGVNLGWFPVQATIVTTGSTGQFVTSLIRSSILPAASQLLLNTGWWIISMKALSSTIAAEDFVYYARYRGMSENKIGFGYVFRNSILTQITALAMSLGGAFNGALMTEIIFSYPGVGKLMQNAVLQSDYNMIEGTITLSIISIATCTLIADLVYPFIDPRIRYA